MRGGGGSSGYLKKSTVVATPLGLPSPSGSTSETSDYQRSTPSPREEQTGGTYVYSHCSIYVSAVLCYVTCTARRRADWRTFGHF